MTRSEIAARCADEILMLAERDTLTEDNVKYAIERHFEEYETLYEQTVKDAIDRAFEVMRTIDKIAAKETTG